MADVKTEVRGEIMQIITDAMYAGSLVPEDLADAVLAIPEIAERLWCDCGRPRTRGSCTGYCDRDD